MDANDFLVWFKGVCDALGDEPPGQERWDRIRKQVEQVSRVPIAPGHPTPVPVTPTPWAPVAPSIPWTAPVLNPYTISCSTAGDSASTWTPTAAGPTATDWKWYPADPHTEFQ
jgi:hypothetical protein